MSPGASSPRWWIASLLFHAALIVWLLFFSPVRVIDPAARKPAVSASVASKVMDQIRAKQEKSLDESLRSLEDIGRKMADLEERKRDEFGQFAQDMGRNLPAKAADEQKAILQLQAETLAALDKACANTTNFVRTRANAYYGDLSDVQKDIREKQTQITQSQDQAQGLLSLGDPRFAVALNALQEASAAQDRASKAMLEAESARPLSRESRKRAQGLEGQIEHYTYHFRRATEAIENAETNLFKWKKEVVYAKALLERARTNAAIAAAQAAATNSPEAAAYAELLKKALSRAEREVTAAERRVEGAPKELADAIKRRPELEETVAKLLAQLPAEPELTSQDKTLLESQYHARLLQLEARQAQEKAAAAIAAIQGLKDATPAVAATLATLNETAPSQPLVTTGKGADLAQLYQASVRNEESISQSYRRLRALNLAMIQRIPLSRAVQLTEVSKAVRPDLSAGLQMSVKSGEDLPTARDAVQAARAEAGAMVRLASSMLSQAQDLDRTAGSTISMEELWTHNQEMAALASENNSWAADLSRLMGGGGPSGAGNGGGEGGTGGDSGGGGGGGAGGGGMGGGDGTGGPGGGAGGGGTGEGDGTGGPGNGNGLGPSGPQGPFGAGPAVPGARGELGRPENVSAKIFPAPGRRVATRGPLAKWIFADSWYILGPFDNTNRRNIETKFTPEQIIDLNATYRGKFGVPIHWEFQQSSTPNVMPHLDSFNAARRDPLRTPADNYMDNLQYIIYYAYTELWFEEECDLWVAIGSDDFSKLWIEDQLVWSSGKNLKAWQLNEGVRKVHFKKGINRVLYRVENGNNITEFSLVIALKS